MDKQTKAEIATSLSTIANQQYKPDSGEYLKAIASFSRDLLPLFTERSNSNLYKDALRLLKQRAKNCK
jgi:hypothetical protein